MKAQFDVGQHPPLSPICTAAGGLGTPVANLGVQCPVPVAAMPHARRATPGQDRADDLQRVRLTS